jgi:hypothetical protein
MPINAQTVPAMKASANSGLVFVGMQGTYIINGASPAVAGR